PFDPRHEFNDVKEQLCGAGGTYPHINNSGFVTSYSKLDPSHPGEIMKCYAPDQLPVLTTLAQEFAVCEHWFSSMPGPTWPNRFFVHAASSGGLDHSPPPLTSVESLLLKGYTFEHGTIFDRLDKANLSWTIYKGDAFPQALSISGMNIRALEGRFRDFDDFRGDVNNPNFTTSYIFIEPNYGHVLSGDFTDGNSQHPKDDVTRGEGLLKTIYETIRNSPHWENSMLIITYDEHGGFYDHVVPPQTVAPGDAITDPANNTNHFDFKQLGVRVPAVIISPLIPRGVIDATVYDHTSVLATIESIFGFAPLTERDKQANTLNHLFSHITPRTDAITTLPAPAHSGIEDDTLGASPVVRSFATETASATAPVSPSLRGFLHVAYLRDMQATPPAEQANQTARVTNIKTQLDARLYMDEVRQKVEPPNSK
ncbi:MAG TPA: alkaline phosphatase family protein, partial [Ktedonobacteraceae bacterium]|nr:alkaline phosphatase family protein [Ktedonobacteraceae bacterium]